MTSFFLFITLGWGLFYLNELLLYPQVYVRPLAPLLFYVALKDSLALAVTLAVFIGLLQDSYALAPFGVHLLSALIIVGVARLARRTFIMKNALSLIPAMLAALIIQELGVRITLSVIESRDILLADLTWARGLETPGHGHPHPGVFHPDPHPGTPPGAPGPGPPGGGLLVKRVAVSS